MFKDYDVVALKHDLPSENLRAGDTGTVLMVYSASPPTYEVEFTDEDGATLSLLTLEGETLIAAPAPQLRKQAV